MEVLKIENLCYSYPSENDYESFYLKDICLSINEGEFFSILGPNGSGKSTLLKLIAGLLTPESGTITILGKDRSTYSRKELAKVLTYVPQSVFSLFPFSVYEIVMMGRTPYLNFFGYEKKDDIKVVDETLEIFEISHLKEKCINEVSGGEAQRAFLARAVVQNPAILLLDEPNAHLDIKHQISVFNILKELKKNRNISILSISHDLNLAGFYSDNAMLIKNGSTFLNADKHIVFTEENIKEVFEISAVVKRDISNDAINISIIPQN